MVVSSKQAIKADSSHRPLHSNLEMLFKEAHFTQQKRYKISTEMQTFREIFLNSRNLDSGYHTSMKRVNDLKQKLVLLKVLTREKIKTQKSKKNGSYSKFGKGSPFSSSNQKAALELSYHIASFFKIVISIIYKTLVQVTKI